MPTVQFYGALAKGMEGKTHIEPPKNPSSNCKGQNLTQDCSKKSTQQEKKINMITSYRNIIPHIKVHLNGFEVLALIDSRATSSLMSEQLASKLTQKIHLGGPTISGFDGSQKQARQTEPLTILILGMDWLDEAQV
eukprot:GHVP01067819.1.p1 GENE.GHVP01067819.1~~GHVP01067819.1.p1  ORF type:complete len:136 (-),score=18.81 GHVP01067819.1:479-886(-)